jgi:Recombination endonuclease VII
MAAPRTCKVEHDRLVCGLPKLALPSGALSRYCYWDRLAKTSMEAQVREAKRRAQEFARLEGTTGPEIDALVRPPSMDPPWKLCRSCRAWCPTWYMRGARCNPDAYSRTRSKRNQRVYGVEPDDFDRVFELQGGKCGICGNAQLDRSIALDHDHKTGAARGLLCKRCNHDLLGAAFDSLRILKNAVRYLEHPPFSGPWEGRIEK